MPLSQHCDAIATDYDGTIATEGSVDTATIHALRRAHAAGLRLLLVTGRELHDLMNIFPDYAVFDRIVAENGAVLFDPSTARLRMLGMAPLRALTDRLTAARVPFNAGRCIVATTVPHDEVVVTAIRELGLDWHVVFNKDAAMALPSTITKVSGLGAALEELQIQWSQTVGIGDAENDIGFVRACGVGVALANAVPALKRAAAMVSAGERGSGVVEVIDRLLSGTARR